MTEASEKTKQRPALEELLFGLFLAALAGGVFYATRRLSVGTAGDMGPGYVPQAISWGMLLFGLFFVGRSFVIPGERILPPCWRALILIPLAAAVFSLLVMKAGLAIASFLCMLVASAASSETRPLEILVFSLFISAGSVLLFVRALSLPVPIFPW
ncbi:tripartite tricarboxylate transporter TctB family protein [Propionivibrio dicarboxylicus]|uniref:Tripartite tricarboxylate transporter TctB family protein n=1 Tax=Propionivibrio dicarboxylicus TaxID=83767 RepID=A0A1G8M101_9RHOO|nr:tripartite tricarboxylate transporter TctB family protein [Propionivibrio dicarboxylicus]SDI61662.1 Tripartite tricarboxylate transporter TctB family protein [Propionivibrio dicarboxylicus]